ncbi:MAG: PEP-CTERM sorting domain-containing protein [Kiritimatiellales bacterium]|nr:PEP-CTERM sorting domain-containing protein [Kiritimatiellales bacterium]
MKMIRNVAACVLLGTTVHAELLVRGTGTITTGGSGDYQLFYDDVQDITWLDYSAPVAQFDAQNDWASDLVVSYGGQSFDDWRLPSAGDNPTEGVNITTSEMGHLSTDGITGNDPDPFANIEASDPGYWTSTENASDTDRAWVTVFYNGFIYDSGSLHKTVEQRGLAVRNGDMVIPEPATAMLLGLGAIALWARRRRFTT